MIGNTLKRVIFLNMILGILFVFTNVSYVAANTGTVGYAGSRLETVFEREIYKLILEKTKGVADGAVTNTEIMLSLWLPKHSWSVGELGILSMESTELTKAAVFKIRSSVINALDALILDYPYEFYWFNSTRIRIDAWIDWLEYDVGCPDQNTVVLNNMQINMIVNRELQGYRGGSLSECVINKTMVNALSTASKATISTIVEKYKDYSDYDKICAYVDEICRMNSYNSSAATVYANQSGGIDSTMPWQMIWVFDDNPNTNVTCEGYAKALQYLCQQSSFQNSSVECYTVRGEVAVDDGIRESHAWNIISMGNGKNYLVDPTNCDSLNDKKELILVGCADGNVGNGYHLIANGHKLSYYYSPDDKILFGNHLVLDEKSYAVETSMLPSDETDKTNTADYSLTANELVLAKKQKTKVFQVTGLSGGVYVSSWKSENFSLVKISGNANGTATVKAGKKKGSTYIVIALSDGKELRVPVKVQNGKVRTNTIKVEKNYVTLAEKEKWTIHTLVTPITSQDKLKYKSSNKRVAKVSSKGVVQGVRKGDATITVSSGKKNVKIYVSVR